MTPEENVPEREFATYAASHVNGFQLAVAVIHLQQRGRLLHTWYFPVNPLRYSAQWFEAMRVVSRMYMSTTRGLNP